MKKIALSGKYGSGKFTLVDDDIYDLYGKYHWMSTVKGYVIRSFGKRGIDYKSKQLHRLVTSAPADKQVDHINQNKLDNRRLNLRLCTNGQNKANSGPDKRNKSGFKGVSPDGRGNGWVAQIKSNKTNHYLGYFKDKVEAAKAYNQAALKYHGKFAHLNIIPINS